jgi:hypothetical protein
MINKSAPGPHPGMHAAQHKPAGNGGTMAIRRPKPTTQTPGELHEFDPSEWATPEESDWRPGYQRWKAARRAWLADNPNSDLGDWVSVFRAEHQTLMEMVREDPPPPQDAIRRAPDPKPRRTLQALQGR